MRKGHRRTQSAFNVGSDSKAVSHSNQALESNDIIKLLEASENKVASKIVNYEKLEIGQENNYLKFGNMSIEKIATPLPQMAEKPKHPS